MTRKPDARLTAWSRRAVLPSPWRPRRTRTAAFPSRAFWSSCSRRAHSAVRPTNADPSIVMFLSSCPSRPACTGRAEASDLGTVDLLQTSPLRLGAAPWHSRVIGTTAARLRSYLPFAVAAGERSRLRLPAGAGRSLGRGQPASLLRARGGPTAPYRPLHRQRSRRRWWRRSGCRSGSLASRQRARPWKIEGPCEAADRRAGDHGRVLLGGRMGPPRA